MYHVTQLGNSVPVSLFYFPVSQSVNLLNSSDTRDSQVILSFMYRIQLRVRVRRSGFLVDVPSLLQKDPGNVEQSAFFITFEL
jgi:hypothetical protein